MLSVVVKTSPGTPAGLHLASVPRGLPCCRKLPVEPRFGMLRIHNYADRLRHHACLPANPRAEKASCPGPQGLRRLSSHPSGEIAVRRGEAGMLRNGISGERREHMPLRCEPAFQLVPLAFCCPSDSLWTRSGPIGG